MSGWQAYVDNNLVGTGSVTKGAIFGQDGSTWAITPGWNISAAEVKSLTEGFSDNGAKLRANGLYMGGQKHIVLRADERSIYSKVGSSGAASVKTKSAVLVAFYDDKIQPGACANVVEKLADYLIESGY